jgi:hypothetical protein
MKESRKGTDTKKYTCVGVGESEEYEATKSNPTANFSISLM